MPTYSPTRTQYLVKNNKTGVYYVAKKVCGYLRRRSLKTTAETIARAKLADELLAMQNEYGQAAKDASQLTFGECMRAYMRIQESRTDLKPISLHYRHESLKMLEKTWPGYEGIVMRKLTSLEVMEWAKRLDAQYSGTRFNGLLGMVRAAFTIAVKQYAMKVNWAMEVPRKKVPIVAPPLPSNRQFNEMLDHLDAIPQARQGAAFVRLLAYTGLRIGHANKLTPNHIDLLGGWIYSPAFKKNPSVNKIPILPDLRPLLERLVREAPSPTGRLLPTLSPRVAMRNASKKIGVHVTPHKLRHYFSTRCLESGVDVKTVASWLGHKDGGVLLLKRYSHLRDEHSKNMAQKVSFS